MNSDGRGAVKTPYGFPPDRDPFAPFPAAIPWDTPIAELSGLWLHIEGANGSTGMPLRLMAAERGWSLTLRAILPRLKDADGRAPVRVLLTNGSAEWRRADSRGGFHVLLGQLP